MKYLSTSIIISVVVMVAAVFYTLGPDSINNLSERPSRLAMADMTDIMPHGVPTMYGSELDLSYDDINPDSPTLTNQTIAKLAQLDTSINLIGNDKTRYINILYHMDGGMSCEYCCGAKAMIFANGEAACGCAHSYAMRGVAKYLITRHGQHYSDVEIQTEIGKWKTLFFPDQVKDKADILREKTIELTYVNLTANKYRGIKRGDSGNSQVGDC